MLEAVFAVWSYTSWAATMIPVDQAQTRWMVLAVMLLGLFMNASVTGAFETSGWAFVIPLLLIQLGRSLWTLVNSPDVVYREHYVRVLIWLIATSPLWIAGAAVNPEARLLWWALAARIDQIGTWLAQPIPLKHAFEGRLVPQDPNDEPACVFLERIRAQRTAPDAGASAGGSPRRVRPRFRKTAAVQYPLSIPEESAP